MALAIYGFLARKRRIEPAGISYEYSIVKDKLALGLSTLPVLWHTAKLIEQEDDANLESLDWMDEETEKYKKYIARLDPNDAKDQDHYKVLGLTRVRFEATQAQIKTAYRQKVLKYHPDKGKATEGQLRTESVFACIQKAYEQLGMSEEKRRAFDSVDPTFDESVPDSLSPSSFFNVAGPVFERNSRFSVNQPVPLLGDENSDYSHVEHFYDFWFNWKSWREFSYLDAEDKTRGEDRWERREIEKQNKVEREKRRKKDLRRISTFVEMAYSADPRIARMKEENKRRKEEVKQQKRREREQRERAEKEEQMKRERELEAEMVRKKEEEKKAAQAKQQKKKLLTAQRKRIRDLASTLNYWLESAESDAHPARVLAISEQIERLCLSAETDELSSLCGCLAEVKVYDEALGMLRKCSRANESSREKATANGCSQASKIEGIGNNNAAGGWSHAELQLLLKAVNLFPPGTQERWQKVAEYISDHGSGGMRRNEKDVIKQVKLLKSGQLSSSTANSGGSAPASIQKSQQQQNEPKIENNNSNAATANKNSSSPKRLIIVNAAENGAEKDAWSAEQQRQLEKALKETPASDPERWERIAASVEGKTKKQCVRRYKWLAELVKSAKTSDSGK